MRHSLVVAWCAIALAVTACGSARVIRTSGAPVRISTPRYGETAVVHAGDTLYHIATTHGISVLDLAVWNDIAPPYTIHPGQRLRLYPRERPPAASNAITATPRIPVTPGTRRPPVAAQPPATPRPIAPAASAVNPPPSAPAPINGISTWHWPTEGELIGRYAEGDPTRQGIDVGGRAGQPVLAAADGVIVYSGSGLVGYGELVIIKHNDNWLSAYGHNRARLVNEGQLVKAGQPIAEMGHTGAARDMLHFEIRYNGKPVDPLQYLPQR
jgi:lipoprotein NlpD